MLAFPLLAAAQSSWEIVRADYGSGNNWVDVTDRVRSLVQGDLLNFRVDGSLLGAGSRRGLNGALRLQLTDNAGRSRQITYSDSQQVNLRIRTAYQSSLHISRAVYGSGNRSVDVTSRVNSQIEGDQLNLLVNNDSMGGDPAPGQAKTLTLEYALNGRTSQVVINEGDTLRLPYDSTSQSNLQITRARYGAGNRTSDVTSRLNSQIQGDQLNLQVNSDSMGGDPAPGQAKTLTVQYALNGQTNQVVINEGDTLRLPFDSTSDLSQRIRCESVQSDGYGRKYCAANTRNGVRLIRQIGESACTQGSSWGYDTSGVWVDNGCRAEFEMRANGRSTGALTTTIPNGTEISVRTNETIDSRNATVGQRFSGVIAADILDSSGAVMIPRGSDAELVIRSANGGGITSGSDLVLDMNSITVSGTRYVVSTDDLQQQGGQGVGANRRTAVMVGGGAVLGTLIGAIAGGGQGAAIGAAVGAGAGLGAEVLTKGRQVRVPAETLLRFKLDQDLRLQEMR
ncbi:MAG TPA: DUF3395 domain-containing protein [Candidatus Binatia bacterium]